MTESNDNELIGFIASTVETVIDDLKSMRAEMATKEDFARVEGRLSERMSSLDGRLSERIEVTATSIRGDIEQVQLRLDSMEHSLASRFENVEGEISRLRSAVYVLGKDRPDVLRLLGHQTS